MAGILDFFSPRARNDEQPDPTAQFQGFLEDPRGRAALLQAGLSLMGGRSWGDTPTSQIGRAIGSAGEGIRAQEADVQQEAEATSKIQGREATAASRDARLAQGETALGIKQQAEDRKREEMDRVDNRFRSRERRLEAQWDSKIKQAEDRFLLAKTDQERKAARDEVQRLNSEKRTELLQNRAQFEKDRITLGQSVEQNRQSRAQSQTIRDIQKMYQKDMESILRGPKPTIDQWLERNPKLRDLYQGAGAAPTAPAPAEPTPPAAPTTPTRPPASTGGPTTPPTGAPTGPPQPGYSRPGTKNGVPGTWRYNGPVNTPSNWSFTPNSASQPAPTTAPDDEED
jgi:hypothetical protein